MTVRALHLVKSTIGATWAFRQMRELVRLGVEVHVALPSGAVLADAYRQHGVVVHTLQTSLPVGRPDRYRGLFQQFRALIDRVDPDLVHSHFVGTTLTMRLALGRQHPLPRIFQVPGPIHLEHPAFRRAEIGTAGPADRWIGTCRWTCDRYRRSGIPADRIFLSFHGSDLDDFTTVRTGKLRAELELAETVPLIGLVAFIYAPKRYLGQRRGLKGHEDLIDAMAIVQRERSDVVCAFIGGAWNNAVSYEASVRRYGNERIGSAARFLGTRPDVPALYPDLDIAVHPSHTENLGGAAESLIVGVPTIASDVGGFPDIVIPGETGWLVPAKSPDQLAATILEVLGDRAEAHRRAAAGQALTRRILDVRRNAREVADVYRTILGRSDAGTLAGQGATA